MPTYSYICEDCTLPFELVSSMADYEAKPKCPQCLHNKSVYRNYECDNVTGGLATRTIGALAEKNASKMSDDERQALYRKHNEYRFQPKKELPAGMSRINREAPMATQPRKRRPKKDIQNL